MFQTAWLSRFSYSWRQTNCNSAPVLLVLTAEGRCAVSHLQLLYLPPLPSGSQTRFPAAGWGFFFTTYKPKILFQLHWEAATCTRTLLLWFPPINSEANTLPSPFFLLFCCFLPVLAQVGMYTWVWGRRPYGLQLRGGSGGVTKLASACSNTITAKGRARLSECVSTLLSWYLLLCRNIPAAWPAAAPAACASSG